MVQRQLSHMNVTEVMDQKSQESDSAVVNDSSVQGQDGTGRAPASQFRIVAVANVDGEEQAEQTELLDTSGVDPRNSMCLSDSVGDSTSLNSMDIDVSNSTSQPTNETNSVKDGNTPPPTPSPEEPEALTVISMSTVAQATNGHSQLAPTTQQQQQQASSRFRTVTQYVRERWHVEDKRNEDSGNKSGSMVSIPQVTGTLQQQLSLIQSERTGLSSSSATALVGPIEKRELEPSADLLDRQESKLIPRHISAEGSRTPSSPGTVTPVELSAEVNEIHPSSRHSLASSNSSSMSSLHNTEAVDPNLEEESSHKKDDTQVKDSSQPQVSVTSSRTAIVEDPSNTSPQSSSMQTHMDDVGDVLTKLQRLYGVISNDHSNLVNSLHSVRQELATLKEEHKNLKRDYDVIKKENEKMKRDYDVIRKENEKMKAKANKLDNENKMLISRIKAGPQAPPGAS